MFSLRDPNTSYTKHCSALMQTVTTIEKCRL